MTKLDITTLFLCTAFTSLLMGSIIWGIFKFSEHNSNENDKIALKHTYLACFSLFGGFLFNSFIISSNEIVSSGIGTALWALGVTFFLSATLKIKKITHISIKPFYYFLILFSIGFILSIYYNISFSYRTFVASTYIGSLFVFSSLLIVKKEKNINMLTKFSYIIIFLGMLADAFSLLLHSIDLVLNSKQHLLYTSLLEPTLLQSILFMTAFLALQSISFGFLLLFWQKAEDSLLHTANLDSLTATLNRRAIDKILTNHDETYEKNYSLNNHSSIGCVLLDLDFFKTINDKYGHISGDLVLKQFSLHTKQLISDDDYLGRFGGEEFILIFINKTDDYIINITNEIVSSFAKLPIILESEPQFFTVSAGISLYSKESKYRGWQKMLREADIALYYSKSQGRNQTTIYNKSLEKK